MAKLTYVDGSTVIPAAYLNGYEAIRFDLFDEKTTKYDARVALGAAATVHSHSVATTSTAGFMSAPDKQKLDSLVSGGGGSGSFIDGGAASTTEFIDFIDGGGAA